VKIKETKDAEGGEEEDKAVTDEEVYNYIQKNFLSARSNKVKLFTDLIREGSDRWNAATS